MRLFATVALVGTQLVCSLPAYSGPPCEAGSNFAAVDLSNQVSDAFLGNIKRIGISTIIRYYDWTNETLPGKTLTETELALIRKHRLNVAVVFQHHNDKMETFLTPDRGKVDAERSLELARRFKQPRGSAIYFGVDGVDDKFFEESRKGRRAGNDRYGIDLIQRYLSDVSRVFKERNAPFAVGVYGSGLVCRSMLDGGLAKYCWLANATSWPEYQSFEKSRRWSLKQFVPTKGCFGNEVDLNVVNEKSEQFGQWRP